MVDVMELPQVRALVEGLRARDTDSAYRDAPVLDVYGRISVNPETGETEKVDRQITDTLTEVSRRRARLGLVLRDDGRSAWSIRAKRPGWNELVARLESGVVNGVVAWHTDRLMRQPRDLERLISFGDRGLIVASCHGDYNLSNADDRFALRVITAAAAKSSDDTSRRQKRKAAARRAAGHAAGGSARWFGCQARKEESRVPAEQVVAEREAIAWAVRAHLDGLSLQAIGREWVERGLTSTMGQQWTATTVGVILKHPRVAGLLAHDGVVIGAMAGMEAIVSVQEWEELVAKFHTRRRGRPVGRAYLLSGMLQCALCGGRMSGKMSGRTRNDGTKQRRYGCVPMQDALGHGCSRISIGCPATDAAVRAMVVRVLSDPAHARQVARSSQALAKAITSLEAVTADADALGARLGRGEIRLSVFDAAMEPLKARLARFEAMVHQLREAGAERGGVKAGRDEVAAEWDGGDVEHRRAMVRRIAPKGFIVHPYDRAKPKAHADERLSVR
jgi:DNA invertase Pin-like site-specific DNA recombinase